MSGSRKIKKWYWIFFGILCLSFFGLKIWRYRWPHMQIELKDQKLNVLVARDEWHRQRGLGKRESLEKNDGMIFFFSDFGKHAFVMRDIKFPIDIVWFNKGEAVDFAPNVPLEPGKPEQDLKRYLPRQDANLVLELPAGWTIEHGLKIGDKLNLAE